MREEDCFCYKILIDEYIFLRLHAAVFKNYTGEVLKQNKTQAFAVAALYSLLGKKILYPLIAKFEYAAIPGYEELMKDYPEVESVKDDEKRHGDTLNSLL